ncbi:hypothetical protein LOAG_08084 [Loa loa]|uniref:Uncharacterized protein n=1 Tax=Loa loa TaxID=7209 RepID=A0A1S0TUA3_LOALO|nr:hypothetical protein LOAG_08084 [Loa loa]EFO20404.1 hypothetical protein LOAG_08084 [Loa loa]
MKPANPSNIRNKENRAFIRCSTSITDGIILPNKTVLTYMREQSLFEIFVNLNYCFTSSCRLSAVTVAVAVVLGDRVTGMIIVVISDSTSGGADMLSGYKKSV